MTHRLPALAAVAVLAALLGSTTGCRSAEVTRLQRYQGDPVQQPSVIYVYDFRTDNADVRLADDEEDPAALAAEVARHLSKSLIDEMESWRLPIEHKTGPLDVPEDGVAIHGEVVLVDEGSRAKRVFLGFGSGRSRLETIGRLYLPGPRGPKQMAEYRIASKSGAKPGILTTLPIGMAVQGLNAMVLGINALSATAGELSATVAGDAEESASEWSETLEILFDQHGWIDVNTEMIQFE